MGAVLDRNAFHEGGDGITDGHLKRVALSLEIVWSNDLREQLSYEEEYRNIQDNAIDGIRQRRKGLPRDFRALVSQ